MPDGRDIDTGNADVYGYVRDREDALRREITQSIREAVEPLHNRIGKRREDLEAFRREDFGTLGKCVVGIERDLARGAQPGWVALQFSAVEQSVAGVAATLVDVRVACMAASDAALMGAKEYTDTEVAALRSEVKVLREALAAQVSTITTYRNTLIGAIIAFVLALLRDNLLPGGST